MQKVYGNVNIFHNQLLINTTRKGEFLPLFCPSPSLSGKDKICSFKKYERAKTASDRLIAKTEAALKAHRLGEEEKNL